MASSPLYVARQRPLSLMLAALCAQLPLYAQAQTDAPTTSTAKEATLPEVRVSDTQSDTTSSEKTRAYTVHSSKSATGLDLPVRETPQAVSAVTRAQMDDFALTSANKVLEHATGVTVEKVETDRTYYTARGFDITNFQIDGIGTPFAFGLYDGDQDTAIYDRVEVVRGANGLLSGTGNPSATVNFIRKRPTREFQATAGLSYGSWNDHRLDLDVSGSLIQSGKIRGRMVAAKEKTDSYLDRYSLDKTVFYGIVEADLGQDTLLSLGYSQQNNKTKGSLWGALPLYYTDGSATHYDESTSTSPSWTRWNTKTQTAFAELEQRLAYDWKVKTTLSKTWTGEDSKLFYTYGTPDASTGLGLYSYPSLYTNHAHQKQASINASGPFSLLGRKHELMLGWSWGLAVNNEKSLYTADTGLPLPDISHWNGDFAEPTSYTASERGGAISDRYRRLFAAARFDLTDTLKLITGLNNTSVSSYGLAYDEDKSRSDSGTTPYAGIIYNLTPTTSIYTAYTGIFSPQYQVDNQHKTLTPAKGRSLELGIKQELFERKVLASAAVFKASQRNLAESDGYFADGSSYYKGIDTFSKGIEVELAGRITPHLQISTGYTLISIQDANDKDVRTFTPRQLLHVDSTYRLPWFEQVKLGASLRWRSKTWRDQGGGIITRQNPYALLDLMASYDVTEKLNLKLQLNNVTNKKYINSLYWSQGYYGAPFNANVSMTWAY